MRLSDLWIGDVLLLRSSGRTGRFAGIDSSGKARVDIGGKIILTGPGNLEKIPETEQFPDIEAMLAEEKRDNSLRGPAPTRGRRMEQSIDLHIEKLAPHMESQPAGRILEFQLEASDAFIRSAIAAGVPHITIIHGKGQGVLKQAVEHQLKQYPQVKITFSANGGGAVEVWL